MRRKEILNPFLCVHSALILPRVCRMLYNINESRRETKERKGTEEQVLNFVFHYLDNYIFKY